MCSFLFYGFWGTVAIYILLFSFSRGSSTYGEWFLRRVKMQIASCATILVLFLLITTFAGNSLQQCKGSSFSDVNFSGTLFNAILFGGSVLCIVVVLLLIYRQAIFGLLIFGLGAFIYLIGFIFGIDWNVFNISSPQLLVGILGTGVLLIGILGLAVFREINNI